MRRIKKTFEVVTPESAEHGDFAETGWEDEEGAAIEPDDLEVEEHGSGSEAAVALAVDHIGSCVEPSSSDWHPRVWYTDADGDIDYRTGAEKRYSYHLEGFSAVEEEAIFNALCRKRV